MLSKDTQIFASFHPSDEAIVLPILEQIRLAGWGNVDVLGDRTDQPSVLELIRQSGIVLVFLSKAYAQDDRLMLEEFAYAATVVRKPFVPVWLDSLAEIQQNAECDQQLLSTLEMLTARHTGTAIDALIAALEQYTQDNIPYTPSTPQICEKPFEAYEGDEPYIFISYAHDDAQKVYPIIKKLYESGWDLWYDEGIKITERYLPVIAHHVKRCSFFVLMLTSRCLERPFVMNYELEYARQRGIPIIPVLLEELEPQPWLRENVARLMGTAISPDMLLERISSVGLTNRGTRKAVPPAIKHNVVYDVVLPPELPEFRFVVLGEEIRITRYIGTKKEVIIPGTVKSLDGSMTFRVVAIDDYAFTGGGFLIGIGIPDSIKKTDKGAFRRCRVLRSVTIPDSITNIGKYTFSGCKSLKNITIPNNVTNIDDWAFTGCKSLKSITIPDSVTNIGGWAFLNCKSLTNITIPGSVTSIGDHAFRRCTSLTDITIPYSVNSIGRFSFSECKKLKNIILPENLGEIGELEDVFSNCPKLKKISNANKTIPSRGLKENGDAGSCSIPYGATKIDNGYFKNNKNLKSVTIPDSVTSIGDHAFRKCTSLERIIIPDSVTYIGNNAFYGCVSLTNINIPNSVKRIGDEAFFGCKSLKDLTIPEHLKYMGKNAFSNCPLLDAIYYANKTILFRGPGELNSATSYCIPDGIKKIDNSAFEGNKKLRKIIVPNSVTSIGDNAFHGCVSLISINIPDSVTSIGKDAFSDCPLLDAVFYANKTILFRGPGELNSATSFSIPDGIIKIDNRAFSENKNLKSITIPNSITKINDNAFRRCTSLTSIIIPDSVTSIGECAFMDCESLESIVIPNSVTSIGDQAFWGCKLLMNITIPEGVTHIGCMIFENTPMDTKTKKNKLLDDSRITEIEKNETDKESKIETSIQEKNVQFVIPVCQETPRAKVCCATIDVDNISSLLTELYWEGFNLFLNNSSNQQEIEESQCILAFISNKTKDSEQAMNILKHAVQYDVSRIIQVFIGDCTDLPEEIKNKLHDRQAIIQKNCSENEFTGKIRDSLRQFGCNLGHPRGFDVENMGSSIRIVKFHPTDFPQVIIPKTFLNPPLPVTCIGANAFAGCETLESLIIPDTVTSIDDGEEPFGGAFLNCKSLQSVTISDNIKHIGSYAFSGCKSLTSILIPNGVKRIGDNAFSGCKLLAGIVIPDSIKQIGDSIFSDCSSLTSVVIPDGIKEIGISAFSHCSSLTGIVIPNSVKSIGISAFSDCRLLTDINIPKSVKRIRSCTFEGCKSLTGIVIPNSVKSIGNSAFSNCKSLTSVVIPSSVKSIRSSAFESCNSLTEINIPKSVKSIGLSVFSNCELLKSVTIVNKFTDIDKKSYLYDIPDKATGITGKKLILGIYHIAILIFHKITGNNVNNIILDIHNKIIGNKGKKSFYNCKSLTIYTPSDGKAWQYAEKNIIKHEDLKNLSVLYKRMGDHKIMQ
jgi:hypothetical protein